MHWCMGIPAARSVRVGEVGTGCSDLGMRGFPEGQLRNAGCEGRGLPCQQSSGPAPVTLSPPCACSTTHGMNPGSGRCTKVVMRIHLMACRRTTKRALSSSSLISNSVVIFMAAASLALPEKAKTQPPLLSFVSEWHMQLSGQQSRSYGSAIKHNINETSYSITTVSAQAAATKLLRQQRSGVPIRGTISHTKHYSS